MLYKMKKNHQFFGILQTKLLNAFLRNYEQSYSLTNIFDATALHNRSIKLVYDAQQNRSIRVSSPLSSFVIKCKCKKLSPAIKLHILFITHTIFMSILLIIQPKKVGYITSELVVMVETKQTRCTAQNKTTNFVFEAPNLSLPFFNFIFNELKNENLRAFTALFCLELEQFCTTRITSFFVDF